MVLAVALLGRQRPILADAVDLRIRRRRDRAVDAAVDLVELAQPLWRRLKPAFVERLRCAGLGRRVPEPDEPVRRLRGPEAPHERRGSPDAERLSELDE